MVEVKSARNRENVDWRRAAGINSLVRTTDYPTSGVQRFSLSGGVLLCSASFQRLVIQALSMFQWQLVEDVTSLMLRYREASRHVWNSFLRSESRLQGPGIHDWEALKQILFTALVLRNCGHDRCAAALLAPDRYGFSWIKPIVHLHVVPVTDVPVMISRDATPHCGYWDHPIKRVSPNDVDLRFIDFFDFDQSGYIDFQYYLVSIESSSKYPNLQGHRALIEILNARVLAEPPDAADRL